MAETLRDQLQAFAAHLRAPDLQPPPPGLAEARLQVYRTLYFNNLDTLLGGNFPVIRRTLGDAAWQRLVRGFCRDHRARTPLFTEIGQEFVHYLTGAAAAGLPAWLPELAHYEWIELALQISDAAIPPHRDGDLLAGVPVLSPFAACLAYAWPVHRIAPGFQPGEPPPEPTLLLARRDDDGRVRFAELSMLAAQLLTLLEEGGGSGHACLAQLAEHAPAEQRAHLLGEGQALLRRLHRQRVILGIRPEPA
ncbi:MAG TPA: DUF2063 domain-containing protein [Xanthomonadaceae bacterium]|nr:DUF2063 domain-containing protein [Xanthomonadaceae bacterium]